MKLFLALVLLALPSLASAQVAPWLLPALTPRPAVMPLPVMPTMPTMPVYVPTPSPASPPVIVSPNGQFLGVLSPNRFDPLSVANPYGAYGSPYSPTSITNPYSVYGSPYSNLSAKNPYATAPPVIISPAR